VASPAATESGELGKKTEEEQGVRIERRES